MKKVYALVSSTVLTGAFMAAPLAAFAQTNIDGILQTILRLMNLGVPIIMALALLYFLYGLAQFILESHDEAKQKEARDRMIYGVIALFVMISIFSLVRILGSTFNITGGDALPLPKIQAF